MEKLNPKKSPDKEKKEPESDQKNESELVEAFAKASGTVVADTTQSVLVRSELFDAPRSSFQLYRGQRDSFDETIRPNSPSKISKLENVENVINKDGEKITTVRTVKEVFGSCPQIGSLEAFGRQVRETSEKTGQGIKAFKDTKTESIIGDDGTRITRTTQTSRVKYTRGSASLGPLRIPQSSFFSSYQNNDRAAAIEYGQTKSDLEKNEESNSVRVAQSSFFTNYKSVYKSGDYRWDNYSQQQNQTSSSQLTENVPVFVPLSFDHDYDKSSTSKSYLNTSSTSSRYYKGEEDQLKTSEDNNIYSSKTYTSRFKSPFRSVPTIKEIVPPTFSYELENYTVKKGENAVFKGTVNGSFPFEVKWYLDNNELKPSSRIEMIVKQDYTETFLTGLIDYIVSLKILKCSYQDIGKYTVLVKNEAGDASCSAFLIIEGKQKI